MRTRVAAIILAQRGRCPRSASVSFRSVFVSECFACLLHFRQLLGTAANNTLLLQLSTSTGTPEATRGGEGSCQTSLPVFSICEQNASICRRGFRPFWSCLEPLATRPRRRITFGLADKGHFHVKHDYTSTHVRTHHDVHHALPPRFPPLFAPCALSTPHHALPRPTTPSVACTTLYLGRISLPLLR